MRLLFALVIGVIMSFQMIGGDTNDPKQIVNAMNQNIAQLKVEENTKITKDSTGTRRVLLGSGLNDFNGLKVSQVGKDVYTATDDELVFNSDNNLFKIVQTGTTSISLTPGDNNETVTVTHGLGYVPTVIATIYLESSATAIPLPAILQYTVDGTNPISIREFLIMDAVTDDEISFSYYCSPNGYASTRTWTIRYYILQETAN